MGIQNFPASLQPIIQQGFLEREFQQALRSRLGYRACADREEIAVGIGETLTKTRVGLKPTVTTPIPPATNTNFDNGLTPTTWGVEQYTISINHYAATTDLNMVTSRVGIASQFLQNAYVNGEQAARSLDELARNALFSAYFGGNTRVRTTIGSAGPAISVDDIRGFQTNFVNGVQQSVSAANTVDGDRGVGCVYSRRGSCGRHERHHGARRHLRRADILHRRFGLRRDGWKRRYGRGWVCDHPPRAAQQHIHSRRRRHPHDGLSA